MSDRSSEAASGAMSTGRPHFRSPAEWMSRRRTAERRTMYFLTGSTSRAERVKFWRTDGGWRTCPEELNMR